MIDDVQAIKNLVYRYSEAFDTGDFDSAVGLFAEARVRVSGSDATFTGAAIRSLLTDRMRLYDGIPMTKHFITNVIIDIAAGGRDADARSYFVALQALPDFPLQPVLAGRWHDRLTKVDGQWRFEERLIHADLMGDISHHLTVD
ncbi:nuclear transport factor 2 family protein [Mycobacterium barrassiae]|uniref:nuclear transport factor 2 family protein n=1 Tax=Mycobacterium barrassiae TaxID=319709 RepID=UPI002265BC82|nr:nuclear transport factor 2 family protein [Mycobacterium barrassiae]MCV7299769.1 nuclear transport factor 2 family protein [Mycobacterium barrassiae]